MGVLVDRMEFGEFEIPTSVIGMFFVLFVASLAYGIVIMQSLTAPIAVWVDILELGVILFALYLFYRFVVAVETIASKL